mgnify:CR=1 FL=1
MVTTVVVALATESTHMDDNHNVMINVGRGTVVLRRHRMMPVVPNKALLHECLAVAGTKSPLVVGIAGASAHH